MDVASHAVVVDGDELWGDRLEPAGGGLDPRLLVLFEGGNLQVESLRERGAGASALDMMVVIELGLL